LKVENQELREKGGGLVLGCGFWGVFLGGLGWGVGGGVVGGGGGGGGVVFFGLVWCFMHSGGQGGDTNGDNPEDDHAKKNERSVKIETTGSQESQ